MDAHPHTNGYLRRSQAAMLFLLLLAVLLVAGAIWHEVDFKPTATEIKTHKGAADLTKKTLDDAMAGKWPEGYHRSDHKEWCDAFLRANARRYPDLECPSPYDMPSYHRLKK